ncbi:MAG: substrate-binding domain-containing protein [Candidatus Bathyarchaeia archaeon]
MSKKLLLVWASMLILAIVAAVGATTYYSMVTMHGKRKLTVSTTTSLYDTGLLNAIETEFERKYPINLLLMRHGSGQAIEYAKRGDADIILVHAPSSEKTFLIEGYGLCRKIIAYNFFVIVGPEEDPAKIEGLNATAAFKKIVNLNPKSVLWVSRGDESGTHVKEKELWSKAGFDWAKLKEESWFMDSGVGMGTALLIANEKGAYTLSDIGTYLKYYKDGKISLKPFIKEEIELLNVYSCVAVNPSRVSKANFEDAITFIKFLVSDECQTLIENFQKETYGQSLFFPAVQLIKNQTEPISQWIRQAAFLEGAECPPQYWGGHPELYD